MENISPAKLHGPENHIFSQYLGRKTNCSHINVMTPTLLLHFMQPHISLVSPPCFTVLHHDVTGITMAKFTLTRCEQMQYNIWSKHIHFAFTWLKMRNGFLLGVMPFILISHWSLMSHMALIWFSFRGFIRSQLCIYTKKNHVGYMTSNLRIASESTDIDRW